MYYILFYYFVENYPEKRTPFRQSHFNHIQGYIDKGELRLAGAFADPADSAALVFRVSNKNIIENFVKNDPYFKNGLVMDYKIREWTVVAGLDFNE